MAIHIENHAGKPLFCKLTDTSAIPSDELAQLIRVVLNKGSQFQFQVTGQSMVPFIRDGDVVRIAPLDTKKLSPGRIVAYIEPINQKLVVHRIVKLKSSLCWIKGDNTFPQAESWVPHSSILGVVITVERQGKRTWIGIGSIGRHLISLGTRLGIWARINRRLNPN